MMSRCDTFLAKTPFVYLPSDLLACDCPLLILFILSSFSLTLLSLCSFSSLSPYPNFSSLSTSHSIFLVSKGLANQILPFLPFGLPFSPHLSFSLFLGLFQNRQGVREEKNTFMCANKLQNICPPSLIASRLVNIIPVSACVSLLRSWVELLFHFQLYGSSYMIFNRPIDRVPYTCIMPLVQRHIYRLLWYMLNFGYYTHLEVIQVPSKSPI